MPAVECAEAFLSGLLEDLDSSIFDDLPSSSQPPPSAPAQSQSRRLSRGGSVKPDVGCKSTHTSLNIKREFEVEPSQGGKSGLARKRVARDSTTLTPRQVNGAALRVTCEMEAKKLKVEDKLETNLFKGKENEALATDPVPLRTHTNRAGAMKASEAAELMQGIDWNDEIELEDNPTSKATRKPLGSQYFRCVVQGIELDNRLRKTTLAVVSSDFEGPRQVILEDDWIETEIEIGDTVNLVGVSDFDDDASQPLIVDRSRGLVILHPDILVSSTKVADSSHCTRKALLQEIIRSSEPPTPSLVYGNMLHELMQRSLLQGRWDDDFRKETIDEILAENGGSLWSMGLSFEAAREQTLERSAEYEAFAGRFVGDQPKADALLLDTRVADTARSRLAVLETLAVEEDIWSPRHGLKGKIDVSLDTSIMDSVGFARRGTLPFEIKTGRANAGMEHRAQTMLYTLLMSDFYDEEISAGLLYYTQSNEVYQVKAARNEIRGLIHARNRFASILHRRLNQSPQFAVPDATPIDATQSQAEDVDTEEEALWAQLGSPLDNFPSTSQVTSQGDHTLLPPPIDEARSCKNCYVSDACMVYRRTIESETAISDDPEDPLQTQYDEKVGHLNDAHSRFFSKWEELIRLEEREMLKFRKEIWTMSGSERESTGRCLAQMKVDESFVRSTNKADKIHRFVYRLSRDALAQMPGRNGPSQPAPDTFGGALSPNDPIVVSLENPEILAISRGFILSLECDAVTIGVDRSLSEAPQKHKGREARGEPLYRIDKDELATGMGRIRDNLLQLFVAKGDERRRKLIIDLEPPRFDGPVRSRLIPKHLNSDQHDALKKVMAARDYALVLGMPGTGKSTVIAELIKMLVKSNLSVLLTSYTHSAVDNILLKIKDDSLDILRLGNRDKILPSLHQFVLTPEDYSKSLVDIDKKLMRPKVVATTALGINEPIFHKRRFDVCIVDEASQVTLPTCLGPLRFADKFILVGDHNQLPPLVRNQDARRGGLDVSLFKLLSEAHPQSVVNLTQQYRMNEDIMLLTNELVYNGLLKVGNSAIAEKQLHLPRENALAQSEQWLQDIIDPSRKVIFVDTDLLPAREKKTVSLVENETEARLVTEIIKGLSKCQVAEADVGVIALYRQQIHLLERKLRSFPSIEVLTADRSQGRDKECIIISCVRSNERGQVGDLLKDWRRINVCLSRAKSKLIVIGSRTTLMNVDVLEKFFEITDRKDWNYRLPPTVLATLLPDEVVGRQPPQPPPTASPFCSSPSSRPLSLSHNKSGKRNVIMKPTQGRNPLIQDVYHQLV